MYMYETRNLKTTGGDVKMRDIDSLFDSIFESAFPQWVTPFPPTNLEKTEDGYIIEMALAGYKKDDISVVQEGDVLTIAAEKQDKKTTTKNVFRGIKSSAFKKQFTLDKSAEVVGVSLTDGILSVNIRQAAPELKKLNFEIK